MGDSRAATSRRLTWGAALLGLLLAAGLTGPAPAAPPSATATRGTQDTQATEATSKAATWQQGQRVVVTVERDGATSVSRGVPLGGAAVPAGESRDARVVVNRDQDAVRLVLTAPGGATYRRTVPVERFVRGEFPGPDGEIEGHRVPVPRYTFAATLPDLGPGTTLRATLVTRSDTVTGDRVALRTPAESRATGSAERLTGFPTGPSKNRVDLVIMGDGYTEAQQDTFRADALAAAQDLFSTHPYQRYKRYFNVVTAFTSSPESGADHPRYQSGCEAGTSHPISCCPDPSAGSTSKYVATRYDSSYCYYGIDRLLVPIRDDRLMDDATAAYPRWDHLVVIVKDAKYGGSGGTIATTSTHPSGIEVVKHELGHSLMDLADEYSDEANYPSCSDRKRDGITTKCQANVTDVTTRSRIKWREWIEKKTAIPTPSPQDSSVVGLFQGAYYSPTTYYRSCDACIMRYLETPFGAVAAEQMPWSLYRRFGISLIANHRPGKKNLDVSKGERRRFRVKVLAPAGDKVKVTWLVDGKVAKTAMVRNGEWAAYRWTVPDRRAHTVRVKVRERAGTLHQRNVTVSQVRRTWRLE